MKKYMFKKMLCAALSFSLCIAMLSGCGGSVSSDVGSGDQSFASSDGSDTSKPEDNIKPDDEPAEMRDIKSIDLVKEMGAGWILGNTLDAGNENNRGALPETIEKSWGNPVTTKEMIDEVKNKGFNVIRIPVTWDWSTGEAPDYKISEEWLARVKEVVDYTIDDKTFVILNIHHETWHDPYEDNYEAASDRLKKVWTQIGTYFGNYDEHLIFEGMNEPRLRNTKDEWNGGTEAARKVVADLCLDFVKTIRDLGGNNAKRHLMIPGYAAANEEKVLSSIELPENDDKIIISVHAYIPYNFSLAEKGIDRWLGYKVGSTKDINDLCDRLNEMFIKNDVAVIIGEFGARDRNGNETARADYARYFVTKMRTIGVPCLWWDNGAFSGSGELFGIFDRNALNWRYDEIASALVEAANGSFTVEELTQAPQDDET